MIDSIKEYKRYVSIEKNLYLGNKSKFKIMLMAMSLDNTYLTWRFVLHLRRCELLKNFKWKWLSNILLLFERRKKNILGTKLGFEIHENCFEEGLCLYHKNVIVNSLCRCGKNIRFHGMNCIGNDGKVTNVPKLGDNIEFGFGSCALGGINIPSNCIIAANATVLRSFDSSGTIAGTPAFLLTNNN